MFALVGKRAEAHALAATIQDVLQNGCVTDLTVLSPVEMVAGIAAAAGAQWATAETHFETARDRPRASRWS